MYGIEKVQRKNKWERLKKSKFSLIYIIDPNLGGWYVLIPTYIHNNTKDFSNEKKK